MELCVHDKATQNPTAGDVTRAIDATPHPDDWFINLDADDGSYVEATARAGGGYTLVSMAQKRSFSAAAAVDAAQLKTILIKYLNGDASWRAECQWKAEPSKSAPGAARDTSQPPTWALAIVIGTIGFVVLTFSSSWLRSMLPFGDSDYFYIGLIFLPMVVLIVVMIIVKMTEARSASHWPQTAAKILKCGTEARHHQFSGEATTVTNVPAVEYEFTANGRTFRGNRISIGEDTGGAHTEATLARFPVGATVPVYYDPADPTHCVLIRDGMPKGAGKGCAIALAVLVAIGAGLYFFAGAAYKYLEEHLPNSDRAPFVLAATGFGLLTLLFFFAVRRNSKKAATWPSVRGTIVSSGTESYQKREDGRTTTFYTAAVEYAYQVHGVEYHSRQINLGMTTAGSQSGAEKIAGRYPQGAAVDVHYEPENPSNAALENPTGYTWLLLGVALFCFAVAAFAGGLFK